MRTSMTLACPRTRRRSASSRHSRRSVDASSAASSTRLIATWLLSSRSRAVSKPLLRQHLYFWTSKASRLRTCGGVSSSKPLLRQHLYFCTSNASKVSTCAHHRKRSAPSFAGDAVALAAGEGRAAAGAAPPVPRLLVLTRVLVVRALWRRRVVAQLACEVLELAFGAQPLCRPLVPVFFFLRLESGAIEALLRLYEGSDKDLFRIY